ncbi:MAG: cytidine deaminase [Clostridia bacterium]|nr:cytidine deaminase [Clostridia bacterium]
MINKDNLIFMAENAAENAYAPYSNFNVGACILCEDGEIFTGFNIENSSYGATVCAERVALFNAVSQGNTNFTAMAVTSMPCGICLQTLSEFCKPDFKIIVKSDFGEYEEFSMSELLPYPFDKGDNF